MRDAPTAPVLERLQAARDCVVEQVEERDRDFPQYQVTSEPWASVVRMQRYVRTLAPSDLLDIRIHVDSFVGSLLAEYYLPPPAASERRDYPFYGEGVPRSMWACEPGLPGLVRRSYGPRYDGRWITDVAVTNQRHICNLYRMGVFRRLQEKRGTVLEIGAGHGGFAQQFAEHCRSTYIIVDLPEMLLYSAAFLTVHLPDRRLRIYRPGEDIDVGSISQYDFVLIPDYKLPALHELRSIDLAVNHVSFPEMQDLALRTYVHFIRRRLDGYLVSVNYDAARLERIFGEFFDLAPSIRHVTRALGLGTWVQDDLRCRPTQICWSSPDWRAALRGVELRDVIATAAAHYSCSFGADDCTIRPVNLRWHDWLRRFTTKVSGSRVLSTPLSAPP